MASGSQYGKQPLYYGGGKGTPLYYGASKGAPLYYGSGKKTPLYYGANRKTPLYYGAGSNYGASHYYYGGSYGGAAPGQDGDSLVGTITLGRILRVVAQRWISVLVFLLIGLVAAFAVYRISPTIYEAKSEFTMDMRHPSNTGTGIGQIDMPDYGSTYAEVFNTRLSDWRSDKIVTKIVQQYRANYPASTVTDAELITTLASSELDLIRNSRLITIGVRSSSPAIAAALANAYAEAIESFTDDENKIRCDKAVTQIHEAVDKQRRVDEKVAKALLEFRTANKIDNMHSEREIIQQSLTKTTADILGLETEVTAAAEWEKVLEAAQETPEDFGALPTAVPRSTEIGESYTKLQEANLEHGALLAKFTKNHPEVKAKEKELEVYKRQFVEAVGRALATAKGNLAAYQNQLAVFKKKNEQQRTDLATLEQKIVQAEAGLQQLEREKDVSSTLYKDLLQKENEARIAAEANNEIVRVGRPATVPTKPVLPNPVVIFTAGAVLALALGLLFVLVLDHLEDTIISLSDIEGRLGLKVLAVLPHIRRKKREQVARFIQENKYSQFAESMAGLRNMLDSPRYQATSQVLLLMSTQPGEGKTITSCALAISSAQAGKKTLLVDFDLRRPRLARVWGIDLKRDHSFSHVLAAKPQTEQVDFASLPVSAGVEHLDVIVSLPPDDVNPSSIMGSAILNDFFTWARENYDRVIVDSPPYGIVGDVMTLASLVDSVMIMCCPDRTHFKPIQHAARTLAESGATVIGIVVNDVEMGGSGGAFTPVGGHAYGYRSGYGYGGYGYGGYHAYGAYRPYGPLEGGKHKKGAKDAESKDEKAAVAAPAPAAEQPEHTVPVGADAPVEEVPKVNRDIADEA